MGKERGLTPDEEEQYAAWQAGMLADVDEEVGAGGLLKEAGVKVFESNRAYGRPRNGSKTVVLVERTDGRSGFKQVDPGRRDGELDNAAHRRLSGVESERYDMLAQAIDDEISRQRNKK